MKTYLFISILLLVCFSCITNQALTDEKSTVITVDSDTTKTTTVVVSSETVACGVKHPEKNLPWLAELIEFAEGDKTGNYIGRLKPGNYFGSIWLVKFKGQDIFVTNMMLGSGGVAYWFFDCSGNLVLFQNVETVYNPLFVENPFAFTVIGDRDEFLNIISNRKFDIVIYSPF